MATPREATRSRCCSAARRRTARILAHHTGNPIEQVMTDIDRDRFMTPAEALDYGLVDQIVQPRNRNAAM